MNFGVSFSVCSFLYSMLLIIVYFSKERISSIENKSYIGMMISNFFGIIIAILCYYFLVKKDLYPILNLITSKLYLVYVLTWISFFTMYIIIISYTKNNFKEYYKKIKIGLFFIYCILLIILLKLPLYSVNNNGVVYTEGPAATFLSFITFYFITIWLYLCGRNYKKIKNKKYLPIFVFILLGAVVIVIQKLNPGLLIITYLQTFVTFLMYFTIENPDVKLINELELAKSNAEKANQAKTDFLSSMSHEIRTPLNAIVGFSNAILEDKKITEAQEEAKDIVMASENLLEIVNGILDISKIEAGKMEVVETDYNFKEMCDNIIKLVTPRIMEKPIELKSSYPKDLPAILHGDMGKMKEIITNLLTNAAKYTEEGWIELSVSCINKKNKTNLIISVEDTGRGIKPDKIDKLFTKFQRLEEDRNTTLEGTGLGLAITKSLVEMMGGKIVVQSKYGSGSKFTVTIPQVIVSMNEIKVKKEEDTTGTMDYSKKKVLVVDDNNLNIKVALRLLETYNIKPDTCISGFECLEKIKENAYDLILLDDMMPKMSGTEKLNKIKEENKDFKTPVVALTANAIAGMKEKYLADGFDDYLAKPIDKLELKRVLKTYLKK